KLLRRRCLDRHVPLLPIAQCIAICAGDEPTVSTCRGALKVRYPVPDFNHSVRTATVEVSHRLSDRSWHPHTAIVSPPPAHLEDRFRQALAIHLVRRRAYSSVVRVRSKSLRKKSASSAHVSNESA